MTHPLFSRVGVRYEVALGVLEALVAHHSKTITAECKKGSPDEDVIAAAQQAKDDLRTIRAELDPDADEVIEWIITQYGQQARDLDQKSKRRTV